MNFTNKGGSFQLLEKITIAMKQILNPKNAFPSYIYIRLIFTVFSLLVLLIFPKIGFIASEIWSKGINIEKMWFAWAVQLFFSILGLLVFFYTLSYKNRKNIALESNFLAFMLIPDAFTIYLAAAASGGVQSPFYHAIYILIVLHTYYFSKYDLLTLKINWMKRSYGIVTSITVAMSVFCFLAENDNGFSAHLLELFMQTFIALLAAWTAITIQNHELELNKIVKALNETIAEKNQTYSDYDQLLHIRDLQTSFSHALQDVANIATVKSRRDLEKELKEFAKTIVHHLNVEYCSISFVNGYELDEAAVFMQYKNDSQIREILSNLRNEGIKETLVASVLYGRKKTFAWDQAIQGELIEISPDITSQKQVKINSENINIFRQSILKTKSIRHLLVIPITSQQNIEIPSGVMVLINRLENQLKISEKGFSKDEKEILETIAHQLHVSYENYKSHEKERMLREDEAFLNSIILTDDSDSIFRSILQYLNKVMDAYVATLWIPLDEGFGEGAERFKVQLRSVYVGTEDTQSRDDIALEERLYKSDIFPHDESYMGELIYNRNKKLNIHMVESGRESKGRWQDFAQEFGTKANIVIPIIKHTEPIIFGGEFKNYSQLVLGLIYLYRPERKTRSMNNNNNTKFSLDEIKIERLERFVKRLSPIIEKSRFEQRYRQVDILQKKLRNLSKTNNASFYPELANILKNVLSVEVCSIFLLNARNQTLCLAGTTALKGFRNTENKLEEKPINEFIGIDLYPLKENSLSERIFHLNRPVIIYDIRRSLNEPTKFREILENGEYRSLIGTPILGGDGEPIGVIRCINKQQTHRKHQAFEEGDKDFLELVAGVIARLIENFELSIEKGEYLEQLSHELATPLHAMEVQFDFVKKIFLENHKVKDREAQFGYLRESAKHLYHLIEDFRLRFGKGTNQKSEYNFTLVNMYDSITKIRKLLIRYARFNRKIDIVSHISDIPDMYIDKQRFEQVIFNLLQNAIKYSLEGMHKIEISYYLQDKRFDQIKNTSWEVISIKNWGIGILEEEKELIFEDYKRGSNVSKTDPSGAGIGLVVSKEIIENHDGFIEVTHLNNPTIFSIYLPSYLKRRRPYNEDINYR